ncbi:hypothetical protein HIM_00996 [Hirsutella minnesotensis 3608]|nr:hypothetical protein HIM_00996 [Hirsutella minnesotensis 3608]
MMHQGKEGDEHSSASLPLQEAIPEANDGAPLVAATVAEPLEVLATIGALKLMPHIGGGYYVVTDSSPTLIPSPYPRTPLSEDTLIRVGGLRPDFDPAYRTLSSTIFYYLTPGRPVGSFHRNRSRIVHTLHRGRGCYVLIHPDGRVESFIVGSNIEQGEKLQWVVDGGVWKASYLLPSSNSEAGRNASRLDSGLLISETVVPGFEYADHEFLSRERRSEILPDDMARQLKWLVKA